MGRRFLEKNAPQSFVRMQLDELSLCVSTLRIVFYGQFNGRMNEN